MNIRVLLVLKGTVSVVQPDRWCVCVAGGYKDALLHKSFYETTMIKSTTRQAARIICDDPFSTCHGVL